MHYIKHFYIYLTKSCHQDADKILPQSQDQFWELNVTYSKLNNCIITHSLITTRLCQITNGRPWHVICFFKGKCPWFSKGQSVPIVLYYKLYDIRCNKKNITCTQALFNQYFNFTKSLLSKHNISNRTPLHTNMFKGLSMSSVL